MAEMRRRFGRGSTLEQLRLYQVSQQSYRLLNTRVQNQFNQLTPDDVESFDNALTLYFYQEGGSNI